MTQVRRDGNCVQVRFKPDELDLSQLKTMSLLFRTDDGLLVALTCDMEDDDGENLYVPREFARQGDDCADGLCQHRRAGSGRLGGEVRSHLEE